MTERAKLAQEFHDQGYNCAQAVACAYCDLVGLDKDTAYRMAEGFGFGSLREFRPRCRSFTVIHQVLPQNCASSVRKIYSQITLV